MHRSDKHFISKEFLAPNVLEIDVDPALIEPCLKLVPELRRITGNKLPVTLGDGLNLYVQGPATWSSDIRWVSQNDLASMAWFDALYHAIAPYRHVERYIAYDREIVLYSGSFITRSICRDFDWHQDWDKGENDAFVFLTPLSDACEAMRLVYSNLRGGTSEYTYRQGKGLIFGDHFIHSTAPGEAAEPEVLLCLNFGTDRMDNWDQIALTTGRQGNCHRRPDGVFVCGGNPAKPARPGG